jgi:hypothetical protein
MMPEAAAIAPEQMCFTIDSPFVRRWNLTDYHAFIGSSRLAKSESRNAGWFLLDTTLSYQYT